MKLFWKFYSCLLLSIVLSKALELLNKDSLVEVYYHTTIIFSNWFILPYALNVLNILISCIICIFIIGYAFDLQGLSKAPRWLFYAHLLGDCIGHSYEFKMIQSGFSQGKLIGFIELASLILPLLPSYLALWHMTFNQKQSPCLN
jgi:hypothetical protein